MSSALLDFACFLFLDVCANTLWSGRELTIILLFIANVGVLDGIDVCMYITIEFCVSNINVVKKRLRAKNVHKFKN